MALVRLRLLARAAAVLAVAGGVSACSSVPDWVDPTTWVGDSNNSSSATQLDQQTQQQADNSQTPDLANVPDKPAVPSTPDEQKQVADSLQADRAHNEYSGDALRGGTEAAAPPPGAPPPPSADEPAAAPQQRTASNTTPAPRPAPTPATPDQPVPQDTNTADTGNGAIDATGGSGTGDTSAAPSRAVASMPAPSRGGAAVPAVGPAPVRPSSSGMTAMSASASAPLPAMTPSMASSGGPAVPAVPMNGAIPGAQRQVSDSELGFRPSSAPPLDASVSQFVPPSIIARYRETASVAPSSGMRGGPAVPTSMAPVSGKAMGGPEQMSGAVVANFDSLQAGSAVAPAVYASVNGMPPASVVFFPHDTTILSGAAKSQVRNAVQAFQSSGGSGYVRVIGYSANRSSKMSAARRLTYNFERSQARANAVARELIAQGVPASRVLVQAVGDPQTTADEENGRRAEIFIQS